MISTRRKPIPEPLKVISHYYLAVSQLENLNLSEFEILNACYHLQAETNNFIMPEDIGKRLCRSVSAINSNTWRLVDEGYLERFGERAKFNVTTKGEYFLRGFSIILSRLVNESKLSHWNRLKKGDKRRAYVRQSVTKGVKLY